MANTQVTSRDLQTMELLSMRTSTASFQQSHHTSLLPKFALRRCSPDRLSSPRMHEIAHLWSRRNVPRSSTLPSPPPSNLQSANGSLTDTSLYISDAVQQEQELLLKKIGNEMETELRGTCIFLIGMMGSGKSTVGKVLAESLGYQFFDSDKIVEEAAGGASVAKIFEEQDEDSFRDAETEVLKQLSCMGRLVVATGGGIVVRPMNWSYLRHGLTVWLDVPLEVLAERVVAAGTESRPLLGQKMGDSAHRQALGRLSKIFEVRGPFYAHADATVSFQQTASRLGYQNVNALTPTMIAVQVLEEINKLIKYKKRKSPPAA